VKQTNAEVLLALGLLVMCAVMLIVVALVEVSLP
jgi:hypothetical protein